MTKIFLKKEIVYYFIILQLFYISLTFFEIFNLGLLIPFLYTIVDSQGANSSKIFYYVINIFNINFESQREFIFKFGVIILIFFLINGFFQIILLIFTSNFSEKISFLYQKELFKKFLYQDYLSYIKSGSSSFLNLTLNESMRFSSGFLGSILNINQKIYSIFILVLLLFYFNAKILFLIIIFCTFFFVGFYIFSRKYISLISKDTTTLNYKKIASIKSVYNLFEIIHLNKAQEFFIKYFTNCIEKLRLYNIKSYILSSFPRQLLETFFGAFIVLASMFIILGNNNFLADNRGQLIQDLIIFAIISVKLIPQINIVYNNYIKAKANENSYFEIRNYLENNTNHKLIEKKNENKNFNSSLFKLQQFKFIKISELEFSYSSNVLFSKNNFEEKNIALNNINIISGTSGSGKSTFIKILIGLIKPQSIKIFLDNKIIAKDDYNKLFGNFSYVPQKVITFPENFLFNISLGQENIDLRKIEEATKNSEIYNFIMSLDKKFETQLSEDMFNISGGQLQRLAISRALYESKSILLLDETLSSLDSVNKLKILTTLENLVKTKKITVIIVSHDKEVISNKYNIINI